MIQCKPMQTNIYLFYGDNQLTLQKEVQLWKKSFQEKYPDSGNLAEYRQPEKNINEIKNEILTAPFLADKKLVLVYNLNQKLDDKQYKNFLDSLTKIPETTILVIIEEEKVAKNAKLLTNIKKNPHAQVKEFEISSVELFKTSNQLLSKFQKKLSPNLLKELILKLENNPLKIENELTKLCLFTEAAEITTKEIDQIVKFSTHISVFELIDNLSNKQIQKAIRNFNNLLESGEEPTKIFYLIARQLRILIQLLSLKNQNKPEQEIAKLTKLHPFVVKKTLPTLRNFTITKLAQILEQLLKIDTDLKTGKIKYTKNNQTELLIALELVIFDLAS
jgi:DNA polymerase-3 subunit delta